MSKSIFSGLGTKEKVSLFILFASIILYSQSPWIPVIGVFLVFVLFFNRLEWNSSFILLLLTWLVYDFLGLSNGNTSLQMAVFLLVPSVLFFNLGSQWVGRQQSLYSIMIMTGSVIIALALPHIVVTMYDITQVGLVNPDRILSVLSEDAQRSVTQRTVEISMCIGSIGLMLHRGDKSPVIKKMVIIIIIFSILASLCSWHYVSRTGVAIMAVSIVAAMAYEWRLSFKTVIFITIATLAFTWLESTELFEVYSTRETDSSNIFNFGLRLPRWEWAWETMIAHPLGDPTFMSAEHPYAHNFWLDIGKNCGVIPFIMMVMFSITNLINVWRIIIRNKGLLALLTILWTLACYMSLFTEPIHEGAPSFMFVYFFYCGICYKAARVELAN